MQQPTNPMQKEEWEKEFDEMKKDFIAVKQGEWWESDEDYIKSFIHKLLQEKGEEIIKELDKELPNELPSAFEHGVAKGIGIAHIIIKRIMQ